MLNLFLISTDNSVIFVPWKEKKKTLIVLRTKYITVLRIKYFKNHCIKSDDKLTHTMIYSLVPPGDLMDLRKIIRINFYRLGKFLRNIKVLTPI